MPCVEDRGGLDFHGNDPWEGYPVAIVDRVLPPIEVISSMPLEQVGPGSRSVGDFGWISLETVELMIAVEREFSIAISDADAQRVLTVGQLVSYLKDRIET